MVIPSKNVVTKGVRLLNYSLEGQFVEGRFLVEVISRLVAKLWGYVEVSLITILKDDLVIFSLRKMRLGTR